MADRIKNNPPLGKTLKGRRIPQGWKQEVFGPCGFVYFLPSGLKIIESDGGKLEYGEWLHVSFSYPDHLPTWEDTGMVKRILIGPDDSAIIVLPPQAEYVNIHPYCLHLWHRLDGASAPKFARELVAGKLSI